MKNFCKNLERSIAPFNPVHGCYFLRVILAIRSYDRCDFDDEISLLDRAVRPDTSAAIFSIGKYFNESNVVPRDYICPPDRPCIGFPGNYEKYQLNIKAWVRVIR